MHDDVQVFRNKLQALRNTETRHTQLAADARAQIANLLAACPGLTEKEREVPVPLHIRVARTLAPATTRRQA